MFPFSVYLRYVLDENIWELSFFPPCNNIAVFKTSGDAITPKYIAHAFEKNSAAKLEQLYPMS